MRCIDDSLEVGRSPAFQGRAPQRWGSAAGRSAAGLRHRRGGRRGVVPRERRTGLDTPDNNRAARKGTGGRHGSLSTLYVRRRRLARESLPARYQRGGGDERWHSQFRRSITLWDERGDLPGAAGGGRSSHRAGRPRPEGLGTEQREDLWRPAGLSRDSGSIRAGPRIASSWPFVPGRRKRPAPMWRSSSENGASRKPMPCSVVSMHGNRPVFRWNRRCPPHAKGTTNDHR